MTCCSLRNRARISLGAGITFAILAITSLFCNGYFIKPDLKNGSLIFLIVAAIFTLFLVLIYIYYRWQLCRMETTEFNSRRRKSITVMTLLIKAIIASMIGGLVFEGGKVLGKRSNGQNESKTRNFAIINNLIFISMGLLLCLDICLSLVDCRSRNKYRKDQHDYAKQNNASDGNSSTI